jgi:hypothetical protein
MLALKWLLMLFGAGLFGSASALAVYDIFLAAQLRRLLRCNSMDESRAELKARAPRNHLRDDLRWRKDFLGGSAGHGLR